MSPRSSDPVSPIFRRFSSTMFCVRTGGRAAISGQRRPRRGPRRGRSGARSEEQLVNGRYFGSVAMPTLWRGAVQMILDAGHTPQWETPTAFDALVEAFVEETA